MPDLTKLLPKTPGARKQHRRRRDSPNGTKRRQKRKQKKKVSKSVKTGGQDWRQLSSELSCIHTVDEVEVDFGNTLSRKHGDLHVIQGEVFKCSPRAPTLSHCPLILKKLECVDRRTYDLKVYEADTFQRFRVLTYTQYNFAVEVQRAWRGHKARRVLMFERECAIRLLAREHVACA